ncbi:hypothetical protein DFH27DRAFT_530190 [Peziza echinospora]|nr:hypothetical protein DFH27DRAFT_530190 [Peziza echinospora]
MGIIIRLHSVFGSQVLEYQGLRDSFASILRPLSTSYLVNSRPDQQYSSCFQSIYISSQFSPPQMITNRIIFLLLTIIILPPSVLSKNLQGFTLTSSQFNQRNSSSTRTLKIHISRMKPTSKSSAVSTRAPACANDHDGATTNISNTRIINTIYVEINSDPLQEKKAPCQTYPAKHITDHNNINDKFPPPPPTYRISNSPVTENITIGDPSPEPLGCVLQYL